MVSFPDREIQFLCWVSIHTFLFFEKPHWDSFSHLIIRQFYILISWRHMILVVHIRSIYSMKEFYWVCYSRNINERIIYPKSHYRFCQFCFISLYRATLCKQQQWSKSRCTSLCFIIFPFPLTPVSGIKRFRIDHYCSLLSWLPCSLSAAQSIKESLAFQIYF